MEAVDELGFIIMPIFKDSEKLNKYLGSIINWGKIENGFITYQTINGNKTEKISNLGSEFKVKNINEFDLKDSLNRWIKRDNYANQSKEFVLDNNINTGEVYTQYMWRVSVMIQTNETQVKCKLILNN